VQPRECVLAIGLRLAALKPVNRLRIFWHSWVPVTKFPPGEDLKCKGLARD
jgi:hypothetical protein